MGHWALVEIYPLKPLTQHVLAGHGADSTTEDACPRAGLQPHLLRQKIEPSLDVSRPTNKLAEHRIVTVLARVPRAS